MIVVIVFFDHVKQVNNSLMASDKLPTSMSAMIFLCSCYTHAADNNMVERLAVRQWFCIHHAVVTVSDLLSRVLCCTLICNERLFYS